MKRKQILFRNDKVLNTLIKDSYFSDNNPTKGKLISNIENRIELDNATVNECMGATEVKIVNPNILCGTMLFDLYKVGEVSYLKPKNQYCIEHKGKYELY